MGAYNNILAGGGFAKGLDYALRGARPLDGSDPFWARAGNHPPAKNQSFLRRLTDNKTAQPPDSQSLFQPFQPGRANQSLKPRAKNQSFVRRLVDNETGQPPDSQSRPQPFQPRRANPTLEPVIAKQTRLKPGTYSQTALQPGTEPLYFPGWRTDTEAVFSELERTDKRGAFSPPSRQAGRPSIGPVSHQVASWEQFSCTKQRRGGRASTAQDPIQSTNNNFGLTHEVSSPVITVGCSDGSIRGEKQGIERCECLRSYGMDSTGEAAVVCGASADFLCEECGWVCELCSRICSGDSHQLTEIRAIRIVVPEAIGEALARDNGDADEESSGRDTEETVLDSAVTGGRR